VSGKKGTKNILGITLTKFNKFVLIMTATAILQCIRGITIPRVK